MAGDWRIVRICAQDLDSDGEGDDAAESPSSQVPCVTLRLADSLGWLIDLCSLPLSLRARFLADRSFSRLFSSTASPLILLPPLSAKQPLS